MLHLDYLVRNKIRVRHARFRKRSTLLLTGPTRWHERCCVLVLRWVEQQYRPGRFVAEIFAPGDTITFLHVYAEELSWDAYEDWVLDFAANTLAKPEPTYDSAILAAWGVFRLTYKDWFAGLPQDFALDAPTVAEKMAQLHRCVDFLSGRKGELARSWETTAEWLGDYATWLVPLIGRRPPLDFVI